MRTAENLDALRATGSVDGGRRIVDFRYELLDSNNVVIGDVTDLVLDGRIDYNSLADINRTGTFHMIDDGTVDFASDRIKPWVRVYSDLTNEVQTGASCTVFSGGGGGDLFTTTDADAADIPVGARVLVYTAYGALKYDAVRTVISKSSGFGFTNLSVDPDFPAGLPTGDLVKVVELHTTPYEEWPMGVFLLATPGQTTDENQVVTREVEAYDQLLVLHQDKVEDRTTVASGTAYTTAISDLLNSTDGIGTTNIAPSIVTLPTSRDWAPGTSKLQIVNDLLAAINYESLFFDEDGVAVGRPYTAPANRASEYTYADDETSIMASETTNTIDLYDVPNKWVRVVSDPDRPALSSSYTNADPTSPTSTIARGRTIVDFESGIDAADQPSLDLIVLSVAIEASQIYQIFEFSTALNPLHSHSDVYTVQFSELGIDAKFGETEWSMPLKPGEMMSHRARRVVSLA